MGQYIPKSVMSVACPIADLLDANRRRMFNFLDAFSISIISFSLGYILGKLY
jgi:hypothetical protein